MEPKDVVKNWMRLKNTIEYIGLWEKLNNPQFKGVGFDPLLQEAGSNAFTLSPTKWIEQTNAIGIVCTTGRNGGTYAQRDIAFKFANWMRNCNTIEYLGFWETLYNPNLTPSNSRGLEIRQV